MVAYKDGDRVQLISRPGRDHTRRFPELVATIAKLGPTTLILDGEVCIFDQQLVSRFEWLRHGKPPGVATPPLFMAFDCLHAAGAGSPAARALRAAGMARGRSCGAG